MTIPLALQTPPEKQSRRIGSGGLFLAVAVVGLFLLIAATGDLLAPLGPNKIDVANKLAGPSAAHLLGTDHLGRDVLSRIVAGASVAGFVAFSSIGLALLLGAPLGIAAGYGPRWLDGAVMLVVDTLRSLPTIMLALAIATLAGPGLGTVIFVLVLLMAPTYARFARGQVVTLRSATWIEAQRSLGAPATVILFRHLLPNIAGPLCVLASMDIPAAIAFEAGMSFLGLGVRPPQASWGTLVSDSLGFIREAPLLVVATTVPLVAVTIAFTVVGERLRDRFDARRPEGG
jgi:peptide/nickel transport system permease protein